MKMLHKTYDGLWNFENISKTALVQFCVGLIGTLLLLLLFILPQY